MEQAKNDLQYDLHFQSSAVKRPPERSAKFLPTSTPVFLITFPSVLAITISRQLFLVPLEREKIFIIAHN